MADQEPILSSDRQMDSTSDHCSTTPDQSGSAHATPTTGSDQVNTPPEGQSSSSNVGNGSRRVFGSSIPRTSAERGETERRETPRSTLFGETEYMQPTPSGRPPLPRAPFDWSQSLSFTSMFRSLATLAAPSLGIPATTPSSEPANASAESMARRWAVLPDGFPLPPPGLMGPTLSTRSQSDLAGATTSSDENEASSSGIGGASTNEAASRAGTGENGSLRGTYDIHFHVSNDAPATEGGSNTTSSATAGTGEANDPHRAQTLTLTFYISNDIPDVAGAESSPATHEGREDEPATRAGQQQAQPPRSGRTIDFAQLIANARQAATATVPGSQQGGEDGSASEAGQQQPQPANPLHRMPLPPGAFNFGELYARARQRAHQRRSRNQPLVFGPDTPRDPDFPTIPGDGSLDSDLLPDEDPTDRTDNLPIMLLSILLERLNSANPANQHMQGQPPASDAAIAALKIVHFISARRRDKHSRCAICMEEFVVVPPKTSPTLPDGESNTPDDTAHLLMPCHHLFHRTCLVPWLKTSCTCPSCRYEIPTENQEWNAGSEGRMRSRNITTQLVYDTDDEDVSADVSASSSPKAGMKRKRIEKPVEPAEFMDGQLDPNASDESDDEPRLLFPRSKRVRVRRRGRCY